MLFGSPVEVYNDGQIIIFEVFERTHAFAVKNIYADTDKEMVPSTYDGVSASYTFNFRDKTQIVIKLKDERWVRE